MKFDCAAKMDRYRPTEKCRVYDLLKSMLQVKDCEFKVSDGWSEVYMILCPY